MQLVGGRVMMLNPAKGDLLIDAKKVEELMGVPPSQVPDVMALMGDSIDNIPGARDPNDKPAPGRAPQSRNRRSRRAAADSAVWQRRRNSEACERSEARELSRGAREMRRSS